MIVDFAVDIRRSSACDVGTPKVIWLWTRVRDRSG